MKLTPAVYEREDIKRAIARVDARHTAREVGTTTAPELAIWMRDDPSASFFVEDADDPIAGCLCIYTAEDGRLIE